MADELPTPAFPEVELTEVEVIVADPPADVTPLDPPQPPEPEVESAKAKGKGKG